MRPRLPAESRRTTVRGMKIKCAPKGPYLLEGPFEVEGPDGTLHTVEAGKKAALCRCGASVKKPFCDGTHSKVGFEAAEAASKQD